MKKETTKEQKENIIGYLMIISGLGIYFYYSLFKVRSLSDLEFILMGFASAMVLVSGIGILNKIDDRKKER